MDANLRYFQAIGQVTQEYWKAMFGIWRNLPVRLMGTGGPVAVEQSAKHAAATTSSAAGRVLVLEAEARSEAHGVFVVENRMARQVSTAAEASAFADPSGRAVRPKLRIVPGTITLQPGERALVQIYARITDDLEPGVGYRGEVTVPGLSDRGIPLVLRRSLGGATRSVTSPRRRKQR